MEVPQESQACLESQVLWVLQEQLVFPDPKEKAGLWGRRGHQVPRVSQGFKASQESQVSLEKWGPLG